MIRHIFTCSGACSGGVRSGPRRRIAAFAAVFVAAFVIGLAALPGTARAAEDSPTLRRIKERGVITLAYRDFAPPFSSVGANGVPEGYSVDLCLQVVDAIKKEIHMPGLRVNWIPVDAKSRFRVVGHGLADMVCGTTSVWLARMKVVDFSLVTFVTGARLLVRADKTPDLRMIGSGAVGVLAGTTSESALRAYIAKEILPITVVHVRNEVDALRKIDRGEILGYVSDYILLNDIVSKPYFHNRYKVGGEFLSYDPYALIVPRNDSTFREIVNQRLARLFTSRAIYSIHKRWFKGSNSAMPRLLVYAIAVQGFPEK